MREGAAGPAAIDDHDVRRITGPTLEFDGPGAIAELRLADDDGDPEETLAAIADRLGDLHRALGLPAPTIVARRFHRRAGGEGAAVAVHASIDAIDACVDILEAAVTVVAAEGRLRAIDPGPAQEALAAEGRLRAIDPKSAQEALTAQLPRLRQALAAEAQPGLVALADEARRRGLPLLVDDDAVTIGQGRGGRTWPRGQLPTIDAVPWGALGSIPIALVTGTNGKTTSTRVLAHIARTAGRVAGNTSTDGIVVDGVVVEEGDWTGPAAARLLLRRPELELAVLEVARGGILRRGLAVDRADVALLTNIAADHLGEYGVEDEATMAAVKAVTARVVHAGGRVVLGADSPPLLDLGPFAAPIVYFALAPDHPRIREARARGGEVWYRASGAIVRARGADERAIVDVAAVPFTLGGAARYNVLNALGAAAAAAALGLDDASIAAGLASFSSSATQNPGRINRFAVDGAEVILDFAHNSAGIAAVGEVLEALRADRPGGRLTVAIGMAGDRSDDDLAAVAAAIAALRPDRVILRELLDYLRGRAVGDVPRVLAGALARVGVDAARIERADGEVDSLRRALSDAHDGDLIVVMAHTERDEVHAFLAERGASPR